MGDLREEFSLAIAELPSGVHGVAVRLPAADSAKLHPDERLLMSGMGPVRRSHFVGGRSCARLALMRLGVSGPVLMGSDGAPVWPSGVKGSISHTHGIAIAIVGSTDTVDGLGIDLEVAEPLPGPVWDTVLSPRERARLSAADHDDGVSARLAFSAKEAYFKWFRSTGREGPVGFQDVEVESQTGRVHYRPDSAARLPVPNGAYTSELDWLITVAWS